MLAQWILILTLFPADIRQGNSMLAVHGIATKQACESIAHKWLTQNQYTSKTVRGAICVHSIEGAK